jgi:hypothetical protein
LEFNEISFNSNTVGRIEGMILRIDKATFNDEFLKEMAIHVKEIASKQARVQRLKDSLLNDYFTVTDKNKVQATVKRLEKTIVDLQENPFSRVQSSMEDVVIHGLGHAVNNTLMLTDSAKWGYDFTSPSKLFNLGIDFKTTLQSKIDFIAREKGLLIGRYATTNGLEYFAESWTAFLQGKYELIDKEVLKLFNTLINK